MNKKNSFYKKMIMSVTGAALLSVGLSQMPNNTTESVSEVNAAVKTKIVKTIGANSAIYQKNGKKMVKTKVTLKVGKKVHVYAKKTVNGKTYYKIGKNQYIKVANVIGKTRKTAKKTVLYTRSGKVIKNSNIGKGQKIKVYGSVVTIKGKKYYSTKYGYIEINALAKKKPADESNNDTSSTTNTTPTENNSNGSNGNVSIPTGNNSNSSSASGTGSNSSNSNGSESNGSGSNSSSSNGSESNGTGSNSSSSNGSESNGTGSNSSSSNGSESNGSGSNSSSSNGSESNGNGSNSSSSNGSESNGSGSNSSSSNGSESNGNGSNSSSSNGSESNGSGSNSSSSNGSESNGNGSNSSSSNGSDSTGNGSNNSGENVTKNTIVIPKGYTWEKVSAADASDENVGALNQASSEGMKTNRFSSESNADDEEIVDLNNLTSDQNTRLTNFFLDLLNSARSQLGIKQLHADPKNQKLANDIAAIYLRDKKFGFITESEPYGHYIKGLVEAARANGLIIVGNPIENMGVAYQTAGDISIYTEKISMTRAKEFIYDTMVGMLFGGTTEEDGTIRPGTEYHHARGLLDPTNLTGAISFHFGVPESGEGKGYGAVVTHFILISENVIQSSKDSGGTYTAEG